MSAHRCGACSRVRRACMHMYLVRHASCVFGLACSFEKLIERLIGRWKLCCLSMVIAGVVTGVVCACVRAEERGRAWPLPSVAVGGCGRAPKGLGTLARPRRWTAHSQSSVAATVVSAAVESEARRGACARSSTATPSIGFGVGSLASMRSAQGAGKAQVTGWPRRGWLGALLLRSGERGAR